MEGRPFISYTGLHHRQNQTSNNHFGNSFWHEYIIFLNGNLFDKYQMSSLIKDCVADLCDRLTSATQIEEKIDAKL